QTTKDLVALTYLPRL
ncbi:unnamed protein product, partial [Caretta caretta]